VNHGLLGLPGAASGRLQAEGNDFCGSDVAIFFKAENALERCSNF
jgi:hypothetical protein